MDLLEFLEAQDIEDIKRTMTRKINQNFIQYCIDNNLDKVKELLRKDFIKRETIEIGLRKALIQENKSITDLIYNSNLVPKEIIIKEIAQLSNSGYKICPEILLESKDAIICASKTRNTELLSALLQNDYEKNILLECLRNSLKEKNFANTKLFMQKVNVEPEFLKDYLTNKNYFTLDFVNLFQDYYTKQDRIKIIRSNPSKEIINLLKKEITLQEILFNYKIINLVGKYPEGEYYVLNDVQILSSNIPPQCKEFKKIMDNIYVKESKRFLYYQDC